MERWKAILNVGERVMEIMTENDKEGEWIKVKMEHKKEDILHKKLEYTRSGIQEKLYY